MAYTDKERTNIIAQYKQGSSAKDLSTKYGVCERTIYRWAKVYNELHPDKKRTFTVKEYTKASRLEHHPPEHQRLRQSRNV